MKNTTVIAYNTTATGSDDLFTKIAHIALLIAVAIIFGMCLIPKAAADDLTQSRPALSQKIEHRLDAAINSGNAADAERWAGALAKLEEARLAKTLSAESGHRVVFMNRFENWFKSAPAFINAAERMAKKAGVREGSDDWPALQFIKLIVKAADRPITEDEVLNGLRLKLNN